MPCDTQRPLPESGVLQAAIRARSIELGHAAALGRRGEVLEDLCVQLLYEHDGTVPDWDDPRILALLERAARLHTAIHRSSE